MRSYKYYLHSSDKAVALPSSLPHVFINPHNARKESIIYKELPQINTLEKNAKKKKPNDKNRQWL